MQQLFFVRKNMLQWRDVAEPTIQHKQAVLVRPFAVAKCDLDDAFLFHNMPALLSIGNFLGLTDPDFFSQFGKNFFKGPFPFGHECVAEVIETGEDVHSLKPGDVVSVPFQISCGSCVNCNSGNTAFCSKEDSISTYGFTVRRSHVGQACGTLCRCNACKNSFAYKPGTPGKYG
jgi:alcohol dehydrogenase